MRRKIIDSKLLVLMAALAVVVLLGACSGDQQTPPNTNDGGSGGYGTQAPTGPNIVERDNQFVPSEATVKAGDTVVFTNQDAASHQVRINGEDLGQQYQGDAVSWQSSEAGTFTFQCTIHPSMIGTITVR